MTIQNKEVSQIIITSKNGEVLAVISDNEIIEKSGISVAIDFSD